MVFKYASKDKSISFLSSNEEIDWGEDPCESSDSRESKRSLWRVGSDNVEKTFFHASVMLLSVRLPGNVIIVKNTQ